VFSVSGLDAVCPNVTRRSFKTIDLLTTLDLAALSPRVRNHFL
jgi:hypothetical protein